MLSTEGRANAMLKMLDVAMDAYIRAEFEHKSLALVWQRPP